MSIFLDGTCTFPESLDGLWTSSHNGDLTFNSTHVEYPVEATGGNLIFECYELTGTKYLLRSETFPLFSSYAVAVICMELTELKTGLYQMNIYTSKLADANYQRVKYITTSTTVTDSVACDNSANTEFHLLVKNGSLSDVSMQCPDILLGSFVFTFNETSCVNDTGSLDACSGTNLDTLSFNYTACSTEQAYSADGNVQCIHSSTVGSAERVHVYNLDTTTDESTYYRFTCFMFEQSGDRVIGTQHPQDCLSTQTTTSVDSPGATINMTASVTCVPSTTTSTVATAAIVAGVLAALVVLTIAGLLIGYFCWRAKCKKEKVEPRKGLPPTSTGMPTFLSHHMDSGKPQGFNSMKRERSNSTLLSDSRTNLILTPSTLHPNYINKHDAVEIPVPLDAKKSILPPLNDLNGSQLSLLRNEESMLNSTRKQASKGHTKRKKKGAKTKR
ncbi:uncharacterized protein LOC133192240 [Saccostrea echinata]|uniref:uncharacterized protein LOC133192240 n=1 Tax=Saccostrea echinata TaxID=191078 RepID=UPI002A8395EE|nr:uncharacterized protein LOC133192240 [Saccostrea echinata]